MQREAGASLCIRDRGLALHVTVALPLALPALVPGRGIVRLTVWADDELATDGGDALADVLDE